MEGGGRGQLMIKKKGYFLPLFDPYRTSSVAVGPLLTSFIHDNQRYFQELKRGRW